MIATAFTLCYHDFKEFRALSSRSYLLLLLCTAILLIPYLYSVKYYEINLGESLIIQKIIGKMELPIQHINSIDVVRPSKLFLSIRLFGSGGLYGYFGIYHNHTFGRMRWYATQRKNCVVVQMDNNRKYLVTPDNMSTFLEALPQELIHIDIKN